MAGQRIGYVRVSTLHQNEKRQLEGQVLHRVFTDNASGTDTARPELTELLQFARDGDAVVVHSMDRLARNLDDLRALVQGLTRKGVRVEFLKESLVFTGEDSPMANLMLSVMGAFAEFERSLIRERQKEGIALASSARLQRPEKDPHTGTGRRTGPARRQRCPQSPPCPRLRNQPGNRLPVPAPRQAGVSLFLARRHRLPYATPWLDGSSVMKQGVEVASGTPVPWLPHLKALAQEHFRLN
jgi:hypothetical protein